MAQEQWLPLGFLLPDGAKAKQVIVESANWQIIGTSKGNRALLVCDSLNQKWIDSGLLEPGNTTTFNFGNDIYGYLTSPTSQQLSPVSTSDAPNSKADALAFSAAFRETRIIDSSSPLQDGIYVERLSRILPTYSISSKTDDDVVLGYWLTGGADVSVIAFRRLHQLMSWLNRKDLKEVVEATCFKVDEITIGTAETVTTMQNVGMKEEQDKSEGIKSFSLPGRPDLESFFNEHIVDILQNRDRYKALGVGFPPATALHGPPGCGKTFAVEQLVNFLGWPNFAIDASSVASPYIHETSKKVAEVFDNAIEASPSVLVIDEMEAFLADREMGAGHNRVEEVAEFLRRIPEAVKNDVLIIAMTNRIEIIDPAILRRGRFDHVIKVDFASETEVKALLDKLLLSLPIAEHIDVARFAKLLAGRPLSDVSFMVREGARLAARAGKDKLDQESLQAALNCSPSRAREGSTSNRIGFI